MLHENLLIVSLPKVGMSLYLVPMLNMAVSKTKSETLPVIQFVKKGLSNARQVAKKVDEG